MSEAQQQPTLREMLIAQVEDLSLQDVIGRLEEQPLNDDNEDYSRAVTYMAWPDDDLIKELAERPHTFVTVLPFPDDIQPAPVMLYVLEITPTVDDELMEECDGDRDAVREYVATMNARVLVQMMTQHLISEGRSDLLGDLFPVVQIDLNDLQGEGLPKELVEFAASQGIMPPCVDCEKYDECDSPKKIDLADICQCPDCVAAREAMEDDSQPSGQVRVVTRKVLDA